MNESSVSPQITLRIPGHWAHPGELMDRLPDGFRLSPEALRLPCGTKLEFNPLPPDEVFPQIFRTACRRPATRDELAIVDRYTVNVGLIGPGGSLESALTMMEAGAAIIEAGGAGVFIDNSALAHGGSDWLRMTEDGGSDAVSFAFTSIVRGEHDWYTLGMHAMGYPDLLLPRSGQEDDENREETLIEIIRYLCRGDKPVGIGHLLADEQGPRDQMAKGPEDEFAPHSSMHNPFGRMRIVSLKDIAEGN